MIYTTPNKRCLSLLNEGWQERALKVFKDNKVNFSDDIKLTFCGKEIVSLQDCTVIKEKDSCCILTEHNGYHVFFLDEDHQLEITPQKPNSLMELLKGMSYKEQEEFWNRDITEGD